MRQKDPATGRYADGRPRRRFLPAILPVIALAFVVAPSGAAVQASAHIISPVSDRQNTVEDWRNGMAGAKAQLDNFAAAGPGAVIVGGDYNSTPDMRQFRDLLTDGYRDAVEQTGSGFAPTYPSDTRFPPVITIDHVLTRNAAASSVMTIEMPGSDHRSLLVTIEVPLEPVTTN